jgi:hypothetical protein
MVKIYNTIIIAYCSKWLQILVSHIKVRTLTEGVLEQGAEENMDLRGMKYQEAGKNCIMTSFTLCTDHKTLLQS